MINNYKSLKKTYNELPTIAWILIIFYIFYFLNGLINIHRLTMNPLIISGLIVITTFLIASFQILFATTKLSFTNFLCWLKINFVKKIRGRSKLARGRRINKVCHYSVTFFYIGMLLAIYIREPISTSIILCLHLILGIFCAITFLSTFYTKKIFKIYKTGFLLIITSIISTVFYYLAELSSSSVMNSLFNTFKENLPHIHSILLGNIFFLFLAYSFCLIFIYLSSSINKGIKKKLRIPIMLSSVFTSITTIFLYFVNFKYIFYILLSISYQSDTLPVFECNGEERKLQEIEYKNAGYKAINNNVYLVIYKIPEEFIFDAKRLECNNGEIKIKELLR